MKGVATIRLPNGKTREAELHWYEAHVRELDASDRRREGGGVGGGRPQDMGGRVIMVLCPDPAGHGREAGTFGREQPKGVRAGATRGWGAGRVPFPHSVSLRWTD